jgi:DNA excision repair protein ERCC-1
VALVANFGSLKNAINAEQEQLGMISGWGGIKVKRWTAAIEEPFRSKKAAKRGLQRSTQASAGADSQGEDRISRLEQALPLSRVPLRDMPAAGSGSGASSAKGLPAQGRASASTPNQFRFLDDDDDDDDAEDALMAAAIEESKQSSQSASGPANSGHTTDPEQREAGLSGGVAAALAKLRQNG